MDVERGAVQWYWRLVAILSSIMILGGFLILPATFDTDPLLRVAKSVLGIFSVAVLTAGFSFTGLLCFAVKSPLFQADCIFLPALTSCALGLLTIFYNFLISSRYIWNTAALLLTIAASMSTITYGVLLIYTYRKIKGLKTRGQILPLNRQGARPGSFTSETASASNNYQAPGYYENYIANMFPTSTRQLPPHNPEGFDPNLITEEEMQRQQLLMLLLQKDQPPTPDPSQSTFRLDWQPGDSEENAPVHGYYAPPNHAIHTPGSGYPSSAYPMSEFPQTPVLMHSGSASGLSRQWTFDRMPRWDGVLRGVAQRPPRDSNGESQWGVADGTERREHIRR